MSSERHGRTGPGTGKPVLLRKSVPAGTWAQRRSADARREIRDGIEDLIEHASFVSAPDAELRAFAEAVDRALTLIYEQRSDRFESFPPWAAVALTNLYTLQRLGHWHLLRCRFCERWMLAKDRSKTLCRRQDCRRQAVEQKTREKVIEQS